MFHPVRTGRPSPQGVLESPMKPFDDSILLRVIRRGGRAGDVQEGAESRPHCAGKLRTTITGYGGGYAITLNPAYQQGLCAVCSGNRRQWDDFRPASCAVDRGEHVGHSRRLWQWTYQVYVQVRKSAVRDWDVFWL